MQSLDNNTGAFLELVRAGLWEKEARLLPFGEVDYNRVMRLAEEQSVEGLITAGLDHVEGKMAPREAVLQLAGKTLQIESRNLAMNQFICEVVTQMKEAGANPVLVKGQGIAQCYEKPLWRSSGDVDFFLDCDGYEKAKALLLPISSGNKPEGRYSKESGLNIGPWYIELHGTLRTGLSSRVDKVVDSVQKDTFTNRKGRLWRNGDVDVLLPDPDNDVFYVFTHFIKHFYKGGMNLRQLCDWCRLLWAFQGKIDEGLLEERLFQSGLLDEWHSFAAAAVDWLGMPGEAMVLYDERFKDKGTVIIELIMGGFSGRKVRDTFLIFRLFPSNTLRFLPGILFNVNWLKIKERLCRR